MSPGRVYLWEEPVGSRAGNRPDPGHWAIRYYPDWPHTCFYACSESRSGMGLLEAKEGLYRKFGPYVEIVLGRPPTQNEVKP